MPGRRPDPVTPEIVQEWVADVLEEWFDGHYTERLEDDHQRQVKLWSDNVYVVHKVEHHGGKTGNRKFKVTVTVEEVK